MWDIFPKIIEIIIGLFIWKEMSFEGEAIAHKPAVPPNMASPSMLFLRSLSLSFDNYVCHVYPWHKRIGFSRRTACSFM